MAVRIVAHRSVAEDSGGGEDTNVGRKSSQYMERVTEKKGDR